MADKSKWNKGKGKCQYCLRDNIALVNKKKEDICFTCYSRRSRKQPIGAEYIGKHFDVHKRGLERMPMVLTEKPNKIGIAIDSFKMNLDERTIRALVTEYAQICPIAKLDELSKEALTHKLSKVTMESLLTGNIVPPVKKGRRFSAYNQWTEAEDAKLLREYCDFEHFRDKMTKKERIKRNKTLAKELGRTRVAIGWRFYRLRDGKVDPKSHEQVNV